MRPRRCSPVPIRRARVWPPPACAFNQGAHARHSRATADGDKERTGLVDWSWNRPDLAGFLIISSIGEPLPDWLRRGMGGILCFFPKDHGGFVGRPVAFAISNGPTINNLWPAAAAGQPNQVPPLHRPPARHARSGRRMVRCRRRCGRATRAVGARAVL